MGTRLEAAPTPDRRRGFRLASGGTDGTVRLWDAAAGTLVATWPAPGPNVWAVAWSPDGNRVAAAGQSGWRVWDAVPGGWSGRGATGT